MTFYYFIIFMFFFCTTIERHREQHCCMFISKINYNCISHNYFLNETIEWWGNSVVWQFYLYYKNFVWICIEKLQVTSFIDSSSQLWLPRYDVRRPRTTSDQSNVHKIFKDIFLIYFHDKHTFQHRRIESGFAHN